jgi:hypothetical protein
VRDKLNAHIGIVNKHFFKYSILGHVYMLVQVLLEEAKKLAIRTLENSIDNKIEEILTRPSFYSQLNCFPKEIVAQKLVNCAKRCLKKYKNDYKIGSFNNLVEWRRRCRKGIQLFVRGSKT